MFKKLSSFKLILVVFLTMTSLKSMQKENKHACSICQDEPDESKMISLVCKHQYCIDCLNGLIQVTLKDNNTVNLRCPECKEPMHPNDLLKITSDEKALQTLERLQLFDCIKNSPNAKNCPRPNCPFAIIDDNPQRQTYTCEICGLQFCTKCAQTHSSRIECKDVKKADMDEKEFQIWKNRHTKPCPNCHANIEKNQGCPHMTCRKCSHEFLWPCSHPYEHNTSYCRYCNGAPRWIPCGHQYTYGDDICTTCGRIPANRGEDKEESISSSSSTTSPIRRREHLGSYTSSTISQTRRTEQNEVRRLFRRFI